MVGRRRAPIYGPSGEVASSLALCAPSDTGTLEPQMRTAVLRSAERLTRLLRTADRLG